MFATVIFCSTPGGVGALANLLGEEKMAMFKNNTQGNTQKQPAQAQSSSPAGGKEATKSAGSLNILVGEGDEQKMERITGLFKSVSKSGTVYYTGKDREGNRFRVFINE